jgi:MOSC domain-containing protein YiiM
LSSLAEFGDDLDVATVGDPMCSSYRIVSVNVAKPSVLLEWPRGDVTSAIDKRPVDVDELELTTLNLEGDEQADTRPLRGGGQVHGGVHQAIYAFPAEHYPRLESLLDRRLGWGFMGENLTISGAIEHEVCIGDVWGWSGARLEVSAPRGRATSSASAWGARRCARSCARKPW